MLGSEIFVRDKGYENPLHISGNLKGYAHAQDSVHAQEKSEKPLNSASG